MALKQCKECGGQLSTQADICPHCGAKSGKKTPLAAWGCLGIVGLFVFAGIMSNVGSSEKEVARPSSPPLTQQPAKSETLKEESRFVDLTASVGRSLTHMRVVNKDAFDWANVKLDLNSGFIRSGYVLKTARIGMGETFRAELSEFAKSDGTRFDPISMKVLTLSIACDAPNGKKGIHVGSWD